MEEQKTKIAATWHCFFFFFAKEIPWFWFVGLFFFGSNPMVLLCCFVFGRTPRVFFFFLNGGYMNSGGVLVYTCLYFLASGLVFSGLLRWFDGDF